MEVLLPVPCPFSAGVSAVLMLLESAVAVAGFGPRPFAARLERPQWAENFTLFKNITVLNVFFLFFASKIKQYGW
jgi:hypothetical protein